MTGMSALLVLFILSLLQYTNAVLPCKGNKIATLLDFDDIQCNEDCRAMPRPYKDFAFKRLNSPYTGWIPGNQDWPMPMANTSLFPTVYQIGASSLPNILFVGSGEPVVILKTTPRDTMFGMRSINMASLYLDNMNISMTGTRQGNIKYEMNISLPFRQLSTIEFDWDNINEVNIVCFGDNPRAYDTLTFDDVLVCV